MLAFSWELSWLCHEAKANWTILLQIFVYTSNACLGSSSGYLSAIFFNLRDSLGLNVFSRSLYLEEFRSDKCVLLRHSAHRECDVCGCSLLRAFLLIIV